MIQKSRMPVLALAVLLSFPILAACGPSEPSASPSFELVAASDYDSELTRNDWYRPSGLAVSQGGLAYAIAKDSSIKAFSPSLAPVSAPSLPEGATAQAIWIGPDNNLHALCYLVEDGADPRYLDYVLNAETLEQVAEYGADACFLRYAANTTGVKHAYPIDEDSFLIADQMNANLRRMDLDGDQWVQAWELDAQALGLYLPRYDRDLEPMLGGLAYDAAEGRIALSFSFADGGQGGCLVYIKEIQLEYGWDLSFLDAVSGYYVFGGPHGLAFDSDGLCLVANEFHGNLCVYDANALYGYSSPPESSGSAQDGVLSGPVDICLGGGYLYVLDSSQDDQANRLLKYAYQP